MFHWCAAPLCLNKLLSYLLHCQAGREHGLYYFSYRIIILPMAPKKRAEYSVINCSCEMSSGHSFRCVGLRLSSAVSRWRVSAVGGACSCCIIADWILIHVSVAQLLSLLLFFLFLSRNDGEGRLYLSTTISDVIVCNSTLTRLGAMAFVY